MNSDSTLNGSTCAIEGITSPDGKVFGDGDTQKDVEDVFKNIIGNKDQKIFENGVKYFKEHDKTICIEDISIVVYKFV